MSKLTCDVTKRQMDFKESGIQYRFCERQKGSRSLFLRASITCSYETLKSHPAHHCEFI